MKAKTIILIFMTFSLLATSTKAQGWRKRMLEQIAALQVNLDYLKKGYTVVNQGTDLIGDLKKGEYNLHRSFFDSLLIVNPGISGYGKIKDVLAFYDAISKRKSILLTMVSESKFATEGEKRSLRLLLEDVITQAGAELGQLELVLTNGKLAQKDDERIRATELCYNRLRDINYFEKNIYNNFLTLLRLRGDQLRDIRSLSRIYGLEQ